MRRTAEVPNGLPYEAVSLNGRAMEWRAPLWNAIQDWAKGGLDRDSEVVAVERAVETAMRLALELSSAPHREPPGAEDEEEKQCASCGMGPLLPDEQQSRLCGECGAYKAVHGTLPDREWVQRRLLSDSTATRAPERVDGKDERAVRCPSCGGKRITVSMFSGRYCLDCGHDTAPTALGATVTPAPTTGEARGE